MATPNIRNALRYVTVEPVIFLYLFCIFLEFNGLQSMIFTKICLESIRPDHKSDCMKKHNSTIPANITALASEWDQYYSGCMTICTLLVSFYVASWSDFLGRKTIMLIPAVGTLIASCINIALSIFIDTHIAYLLICAVVSGLTFGTVGIIAACFGYLSDIIVDPSTTTKRIVILEAMIFFGGTIGSYFSGAILDKANLDVLFNNYVTLFTVEFSLTVVIILYIILRIKDISNPNEEMRVTRHMTCGQLFSLTHLKEAALLVVKKRRDGKRRKIILMLIALGLNYIAMTAQFRLAFLYTKSQLNWTITDYSHYSSLQFALEGVALLLGLPIALQFWNIPDILIAVVSLLSRFAGYALFGFSWNSAMLYSCAGLLICSEFAVPAIRSMLSKLVEANEKGKIFAFTTIIQNLCFCVGSFALPSLFQLSLKLPYPGAGIPFEVVAILQLLAVGIFGYIHFTSRGKASYKRMTHVVESSCENVETSEPYAIN